jgi:hypothetical protein
MSFSAFSAPQRASFQLGFTPAAQARFNTASQALMVLYNQVQTQLDQLGVGDQVSAQQAQWQSTLTSLMGEADALIAASSAAGDANLQSMLDSLTSVGARMRTLSQQVLGVRASNSPSALAQKGWLLGALAIGLGLGAGFLYLSFTKRA